MEQSKIWTEGKKNLERREGERKRQSGERGKGEVATKGEGKCVESLWKVCGIKELKVRKRQNAAEVFLLFVPKVLIW